MAEYEYQCLKCKKPFTITESMGEHGVKTSRCPTCRSTRVVQVLSPFVAKTSKKS